MSNRERETQANAECKRSAAGLLNALRGKKSILVLMHDNPDPDAIAVAMAMRALIVHQLGRQPVLAFGGIIGRAENKAMVDILGVDMRPATQLDAHSFDAVVLVDTQPEAGNHSLPADVTPAVVIDHHLPRQEATDRAPFADVRPGCGASSTILLGYLRELAVPIDGKLATALYYGIKVDTQDLGRHGSKADVDAYMFLFPLLDRALLSRIEYPKLPREYFATLQDALSSSCTHGNVVISILDSVQNPNVVAEVADMLLRLDGMLWSVCLGFYDGQLFISIRTADPDGNAYEIIHCAMGSAGTRGGHGMLAGGRIDLAAKSPRERAATRDKLAHRFLKVLGADNARGVPLLRGSQAYASGTIG